MFVSKATISSNWLTLRCINSNASLCFIMNDKCLEESSVNWQPPLQHANSVKIPSADADKLICMIGRLVDKHTHEFIVQIQFRWFICVFTDHLLTNLFIQPNFY